MATAPPPIVLPENLMRSLTLAVFLACLASACNSNLNLGTNDGGDPRSEAGHTPSGSGTGSQGDGATFFSYGDSGPDSTLDSATDAQSALPGDGGGGAILAALDVGADDAGASCVRSCSAVAGTAIPFGSDNAPATELVGSWRVCTGSLGIGPKDAIGIEFDAAGDSLYYLVAGPSGTPERGGGFAYQGTYEPTFYDGVVYLQLTTGADTVTYQPIYSACPRQFWMAISSVVIP